MIQGLTPGPLLFQKHVNIIYGIFVAMLVINVVVLAIGKIAVRWAALTSRVPKEILFPIVFILCTFGSYAVNNSLFDVWVMIAVGGLGYLMRIFKLPQAPFVIAFILSPLFENGLRRALIMSRGNFLAFFSHPIADVFFALTILSIVVMLLGKKKEALKMTEE